MAVPILETERLLLRAHSRADFAFCFEIWSNETIVRYITGRASTHEEVWARLLRYAGHWQYQGYGYFLAIEKASNVPVGEVGIAEYHRGSELTNNEPPEAGWAFLQHYHGQGLAHEAMVAVLDWAAGRGISETTCRIDPANTASLRLADKLGYLKYDQIRGDDYDSVLLKKATGRTDPFCGDRAFPP
jgi:RimJ/RimL family protein N-acetyltransferase